MARKRKNAQDQPKEQTAPAAKAPKERGGKVGGSRRAAENFGGKGDFGIPAGEAVPNDLRPHNPEHPSIEDHADDHRSIAPEGTGQRTRGVGTEDRGKPGHGSAGDVDTDVIGVGTGGTSVSASGEIHEPPGPDDVAEAEGTPKASKPPRGKGGGGKGVR